MYYGFQVTQHIDACMSNPEKAKRDAEKNKFESNTIDFLIVPIEEMMRDGTPTDIVIKTDDFGSQTIINQNHSGRPVTFERMKEIQAMSASQVKTCKTKEKLMWFKH